MFQNPKIVLKPETKRRLDKVKVGDESYNSVISRLLEKGRAVKSASPSSLFGNTHSGPREKDSSGEKKSSDEKNSSGVPL